MSTYVVEWAPLAQAGYTEILEYLKSNWPINVLASFVERTEVVIDFIGKNPLQYQHFEERNIHRCVVVKQISLFYRIKGDKIEILAFWDNRRKPAKIRSLLKKVNSKNYKHKVNLSQF